MNLLNVKDTQSFYHSYNFRQVKQLYFTIRSTGWTSTKDGLKWYLWYKIYYETITKEISFHYLSQISNRRRFTIDPIFCKEPRYQRNRKANFEKCCQISDGLTLIFPKSGHPSIYITTSNTNYNIKYSPKGLESAIITNYQIFTEVGCIEFIWWIIIIVAESLAAFG